MQRLQFDTPLEVKFVAETGLFEGYASVFNIIDSVNDKIIRGAFRESLAKCHETGKFPPMLWQHNTNEPIGRWLDMYEDEHGLFVKGNLFVNEVQAAKEAYKLLEEKVVTGLSIGYKTIESFKEPKSGVRVLTKVDLQEVSLVTFPANTYARVSRLRKPYGGSDVPSEREFEALLRNAGLSRKQAKSVVAQGYKGLHANNATEDAINALKEKVTHATSAIKNDTPMHEMMALAKRMREAAEELKFDPNQPRAPAGTSTGGQWVNGGGGSTSATTRRRSGNRHSVLLKPQSKPQPQKRPRNLYESHLRAQTYNRNAPAGVPVQDLEINPDFGIPTWSAEGAVNPTVSPLDLIGAGGKPVATGASRATTRIYKHASKLDKYDAIALTERIYSKATGKPLSRGAGNARIKRAEGAIDDFLSGKPDYAKPNKAGDMVIMRKGKKVRFDIQNSHGESPHMHLQVQNKKGKWVDATDTHRIIFKKER